MPDRLHVACSTDARFAADCAVMLSSLVATNAPERLHVHLLHDDSLTASEVASLRAIVTESGAGFTSLTELEERATGLSRSDRFPVRAWYRVWLPELLPELERILYLDADILVTAALHPLWETDLRGHLLAAVTNPLYASMVPRVQTELGLPDGASYFNSGVLLIDLDAWRAAGTTDAVLDFAARHPDLIWPDQDALNGVLHADRLHLHPRWNAMPGLWELPRRFLPYTHSQAQEAAAAPVVVHFVGPHKPWHYRSRHPYRAQFFAYLAQTPWRERPIEGRSAWQALLRALPAYWAYRVEVAVDRWPRGSQEAWWRLRASLGRLRRMGRRAGWR